MDGHIKIDFTYAEGNLSLSDALYLPENHTLTQEEIEAIKKERFDRWKEYILNPPPTPDTEPIVDELVEDPLYPSNNVDGNTEETTSS